MSSGAIHVHVGAPVAAAYIYALCRWGWKQRVDCVLDKLSIATQGWKFHKNYGLSHNTIVHCNDHVHV